MLNSMQKLFLVLALPGKADYFVSAFIVLFMLKNIPLFQAGVTGAAMSGVVAGEGGGRSQTSIPVLHSGSHFRHGLLQLMIHTIDPLHDGKESYTMKLRMFNVC